MNSTIPNTFEGHKELRASKRASWTGKLANNTYQVEGTDVYGVRLHNTVVAKLYRDGTYEFYTGGWRTMTTKGRINEAMPDGWYVTSMSSQHGPTSRDCNGQKWILCRHSDDGYGTQVEYVVGDSWTMRPDAGGGFEIEGGQRLVRCALVKTAEGCKALELNYDGTGANAFEENGGHGEADIDLGKETTREGKGVWKLLARLRDDGFYPVVCKRETLRKQIERTLKRRAIA